MSDHPSQTVTVLDRCAGIEVPGDRFREPVNEYGVLLRLRQALNWICGIADQYDRIVMERVNPGGDRLCRIWGNHAAFEGIPLGMLACLYEWYAVSACQYARIVGMIAHQGKRKCGEKVTRYVKSVMPEILEYRNKVAAHYAWTMDDSRDNDAERLASVLPPISFVDRAFYAGAWKVTRTSGGKPSDSSELKPWNVTEQHCLLRDRYWPGEPTERKQTMSISDRLADSRLLYSQGRRDGALLSVLVAVAATSRRRYPQPVKDGDAFSQFIADEMLVVTGGAIENVNVKVPGADPEKYQDQMMPLGVCLYKFVRCQLAHEGTMPNSVEFIEGGSDYSSIQVTESALRLSEDHMVRLGRTVEFAPENLDQFPHVAEMPDDVVGWLLFKKHRGNRQDYIAARRERIERLRNSPPPAQSVSEE